MKQGESTVVGFLCGVLQQNIIFKKIACKKGEIGVNDVSDYNVCCICNVFLICFFSPVIRLRNQSCILIVCR